MKNSTFVLVVIIALGLILRLIFLGSIPNGLSNDEAALGYNAYSILLTGKDEYGISFPLAFKSFGEYKAPLYIYLTVPFIAIFSLNDFSVRLPSVVFAIFTIYFLYLLVLRLSKSTILALSASFTLAIIPWHIQFTRIAYEGSLTLLLLTLSTLSFIKGLKSTKFFILSFILFALSFYSHFAVRLFIPLFVMYLLFIFKNDLLQNKKKLLYALIVGAIVILPLIPHLFSQSGLSRAKSISLTSNPGLISKINENRLFYNQSNPDSFISASLFYNRPIEYSYQFIKNYSAHFSPIFLFFEGDGDIIFNTPNTGPLLILFIPFVILGLINICKFNLLSKITFGWLILAPIASSITRLYASTNRAFIMLIPISIIIGCALEFVLRNIRSKKVLALLIIYIVLFAGEYLYYLNNYYFILPLKRENDDRVANKEVIRYISSNLSYYKEIWVNDNPQSYIQFLFYTKYPPRSFQDEANLTSIDEFGFGKINRFGPYVFDSSERKESENILYVSRNEGEPEGFTLKDRFYKKNGDVSYYIYEK